MSFVNLLGSLGPLKAMFRNDNEEDVKLLEQAMSLLRLSTLYCLKRRLGSTFDPDTANALAVAVVSVVILEPAEDEAFAAFFERHRKVIQAQAQEIHKHEELCGPSGCASYLYAAEILHSAMSKAYRPHGSQSSEKSTRALDEQAAKLRIVVPTVEEICGSNDRVKCIDAILSFAKAFYYTNTWNAPSETLADVPLPSIPPDYQFLSNTLLHDSAALTAESDDELSGTGSDGRRITSESDDGYVSNSEVS